MVSTPGWNLTSELQFISDLLKYLAQKGVLCRMFCAGQGRIWCGQMNVLHMMFGNSLAKKQLYKFSFNCSYHKTENKWNLSLLKGIFKIV